MPTQPESLLPSRPPRSFRKLPDSPDLDQLKTQAKELLRRYDTNDPNAVAEVLESFRPSADAPLTLAQAQLVLARSYGFDSWPKLKARVEGVHKQALVDAITADDLDAARSILNRRPELANATTGTGEKQMVHVTVTADRPAMLRLLMDHGADARRGIWPHRESTTALQMAVDRRADTLVAIIREAEAERREAMSCPNVTVSPEQAELAKLIRAGLHDEAIAKLEAAPDLIKQCDLDGATPLHIACEFAVEPVVVWLCERGANTRKVDAQGHTPLDRAVLGASWFAADRVEPARRIMRRLRAHGSAWTPLSAAAMGEIDALRRMHAESPKRLTEGLQWSSGGVLSAAAVFNQVEAAAALLDLGLPADEPIPLGRATDDEEAWSWGGPLWRAAMYGRFDLARLLLDRGADPNANVYASGWPLDRAYERGDRAMVDLLYARGAKPSVYTVCAAHDLEAARAVLHDNRDDPLAAREMVWSAAYQTSLPIVELALPRLIDLKDRLTEQELDWHGLLCQPMRIAGPNEHVRPTEYRDEHRFAIMQMLLDAGGSPNATGRFGLTLLDFVATIGKRPGIEDYPDAPRNRFAKLLLDAGADPSLRDELLCSTALGWACRYGCTALTRLYLEQGVPVDEPDTPPWARPIAWAERMGHAEIADLLRSHGAEQASG
ncbi:MAG: ankyrin repeat domain-containing protein [Planctomycetota bacterium]